MGRQIYTRVSDFERSRVGSKMRSQIYNTSYPGTGEAWRTIGFIREDASIGNWNQETQVPVENGMELKLLKLGGHFSNFKDNREIPFLVSLSENACYEITESGIVYQNFENALELSRMISLPVRKGFRHDSFKQSLAIGQGIIDNIPDGTLFEVVNYKK